MPGGSRTELRVQANPSILACGVEKRQTWAESSEEWLVLSHNWRHPELGEGSLRAESNASGEAPREIPFDCAQGRLSPG
jgi:hypothetical protein